MVYFYLLPRTKVECGGQCLSYSGCEAFNFVNNVCILLKAEYLYKDGTTQTEVYLTPDKVKGNSKTKQKSRKRIKRTQNDSACSLI